MASSLQQTWVPAIVSSASQKFQRVLTFAEQDVSLRVWAAWIVSFAVFSALLPRDASYDVVHYQLHNGWAWWDNRLGRDAAPAEMHSFLNPVWQIGIWWLIEHLPGRAFAFLLGAVQGLLLPVFYAVHRRALSLITPQPPVSLVVVLTVSGLLCSVMYGQFSSIRNDWMGALVFGAALLAVLPRDRGQVQLGALALASLGLGLSFGMKPTHFIYVVVFAAMVPVAVSGWTERIRAAALCASAGLLGIMVAGGVWAYWLYHTFGNPMFPMLNGWFEAPLGPDEAFRDLRYLPASLVEAFIRPFADITGLRPSNDFNTFDLRLGLLMLALPMLLVAARNRAVLGLAIGLSAALILWTMVFSIARYGIGLWMVSPLVAVLVVASVKPRFLYQPNVILGIIGVCFILVATTDGSNPRRAPWTTILGPYVTASIPEPKRFENSVVLFSGPLPSAFLAPYFPKSATFGHAVPAVWSQPALKHYRDVYVSQQIESGRPLFAVILESRDNFDITSTGLTEQHGLTVERGSCDYVVSSFDAPKLRWLVCPLTRTDRTTQ